MRREAGTIKEEGGVNAVSATRRQYRELVDGTLEVKIHVDPRFKVSFLELFPSIDMPIALAPLNADFERQLSHAPISYAQSDSYNKNTAKNTESSCAVSLAKKMHRDGYFRNPKLWAAIEKAGIYTQAQHKTWIEQQMCSSPMFTGIQCYGDICAHHVNSAALPAAGKATDTPRKVPDWFTVPLCHAHHMEWAHGTASREEKQKMLEFAVNETAGQIRENIKSHLRIESLKELTQEMLDGFEREIGL